EFDRINIERQAWTPPTNSKTGEPTPPPRARKVTTAIVSSVMQAVTSITLLPERFEMPSWLDDPRRDRNNFIAVANGIIDLRKLLAGDIDNAIVPHSPLWF